MQVLKHYYLLPHVHPNYSDSGHLHRDCDHHRDHQVLGMRDITDGVSEVNRSKIKSGGVLHMLPLLNGSRQQNLAEIQELCVEV